MLLNDGGSLVYSFTSGGNVYFSASSVTAGQFASRLDFASGTYLTGGTITDAAGNNVVLPTPGGSNDPLYARNLPWMRWPPP